MSDLPPTSVLLPTTRWTPACDEVAEQLRPVDELLIVADAERDPVANRGDLPDGVELVVAGEPARCSGKANAIAAGMDAAANDRLVWTDDDFRHPPDWLATLQADYERHGPAGETPFFVGRDPLAVLLEPVYAVGATLGVYYEDIAWGGAVIFERDDLDEAAFRRDLDRTISDDGTLSDHLDVTTVRRTRRVPAGGTLRATAERHVRFTQIVRWHTPLGLAKACAVGAASTGLGLLAPLPTALLLTLVTAAIYAAFGVRRWTALLAFPATLAALPLVAYGLARRTFVWGGRRYRWRGKFDVEILER